MDTLRLTHDWQPLDIIDWQRAMVLIYEGKVAILEEYADRTVRSAHQVHHIPAVVHHIKPVRKRKLKVRFSRAGIYDRDHGRCCYCARVVAFSSMSYDHLVPRSKGGRTTWENIVLACIDCNREKGSKTLEEAGMRLLTQPHKPAARGLIAPIYHWDEGLPEEWRNYLPKRPEGIQGPIPDVVRRVLRRVV